GSRANRVEKGAPGVAGERQYRAVRILAVADGDAARHLSHLDAVARRIAVAALSPRRDFNALTCGDVVAVVPQRSVGRGRGAHDEFSSGLSRTSGLRPSGTSDESVASRNHSRRSPECDIPPLRPV